MQTTGISRPDRNGNPLRFFSEEIEVDSGTNGNKKFHSSSPKKYKL
jgi:hypothetical protein